MAAEESSATAMPPPYTVDGIMERVNSFSEAIELRTGVSLSLTTLIWAVFISSLLVSLVSYLLLRLTRSGLDRMLFKGQRLKNMILSRAVTSLPRDVVSYVQAHAEKNNSEKVLEAANIYSKTNQMMHLGETKGKIVDVIVAETDPKVVIELGAYFGYSAVRMARLMKTEGARLISIEFNPSSAEASQDFVEWAGLSDRVEIVTGSAAEMIPLLKDRFGIKEVDLVFIDHRKDLYVSDLQLLEKTGLMKRGTVVVADNVLFPGAPDYAKYVRSTRKYTSCTYPVHFTEAAVGIVDTVEKSTYQG